ncbi:MAG: hypothetical protein CVT75_07840, partial [Alphaproteobacteria bacterium HGW-Alphaproteobacteria-14]
MRIIVPRALTAINAFVWFGKSSNLALPVAPELARERDGIRFREFQRIMALEIKMPALSPTMEEGTLARW